MGSIFESFEQAIAGAINAQVHEEMKPAFQLLDDRIVALEKGKVQTTLPGDVENALTDEQEARVEAIVAEADITDMVQHAIDYNGAGEAAIESAVENYVDNNLDGDSIVRQIRAAMQAYGIPVLASLNVHGKVEQPR